MTHPADDAFTVSVIIPSSRPDLLGGQLRALSLQAFDEPWELVIVTGSPPADIHDVVRGFDGTVRVVAQPVLLGPGAARNLGVREASADLLAFCDDDDEVSDRWLAGLVEALEASEAAAGPWHLDKLNDAATIAAYGYPARQEELATIGGWLPFGETSSLAMRRSAFDTVGGFDEAFVTAEDRDISARLHLAGLTLAFVPSAVVHRRLRRSTGDIVVQGYRWARGEVLLYRRHRHEGMPGGDGGRAWLRLLRDVPHLVSRAHRVAWLRRLAARLGRLVGSARYRTWYP